MNKHKFILIEYDRTPIDPSDNELVRYSKTLANMVRCHKHYDGEYEKHECLAKELLVGNFEAKGHFTDEIVANADFVALILDLIGGKK